MIVTLSDGCTLQIDKSTLLLSFQTTILPIYSVACLSTQVTHSAFSLRRLIRCVALYTLLRSSTTISIGSIPAGTQMASMETVQQALTHLNTAFCGTKAIFVLRYFLALMAAKIGAPFRRTDMASFANSLCLLSLSPTMLDISQLMRATILSALLPCGTITDT